MALPRAVQEAKERSDQADAAARKAQQPDPVPVADPPADPPTTPDPQDPQTPVEDPKREDWKAKYLTLQGMYNAEVPRLHKDLKAANARIEELVTEVAALKAAAVAPKPAVVVETPSVPQALIDALGADAAEAITRIIGDKAEAVRVDLGKELDPLKEKVDTSAKTAETLVADRAVEAKNTFLAELSRRVPDWQAVDTREDWQAFLVQRDPFARRPRGELLTEAAQAGDIDAVQAFFDAFKKSAGLVKSDPPPAKDEKVKDEKGTAHLEVPPIAGRAAAPTVEKKTWTKKEVETFYADVTKGVYTRERAVELGRDIEAASREGRIR